MMIKSYSNMSYHTMEEPIFEPNVTFFRDLSLKFEEASAIMPFVDF